METFDEKMNNEEFLQSEHWRKFQEAVGRKTYHIESKSPSYPPFEKREGFSFWANIIEHSLPILGKYFYIPRGPIISGQETRNKKQETNNRDSSLTLRMTELISLAKKNNIGWIRIEPKDSHVLDLIRKNWRVVKAPHDMQPRELFIIDITKSEEELMAAMKPKTRYSVRLAEKKRVSLRITNRYENTNKKDLAEFIRLTKITAKRVGIIPHPDSYYRKMLEVIPSDIIKLYVAEYKGKIIAANIVLFYGKMSTYLHGASDNEHRNVMAPFLLQWQAIIDAKRSGCERYDFGGISTNCESNTNIRINNSWAGITRFKMGFSPETKPTEYCGSWDIVLKPFQYRLYKIFSKVRGLA